MSRSAAARLAASCAAFLCAVSLSATLGARSAHAYSKTASFGPESQSTFAAKTFDYDLAVDKDVTSSGTLFMTIVGDFDEPDETLSLSVDGGPPEIIFAGSGGDKCVRIDFTYEIPQAVMESAAGDGQIQLVFTTDKVSSAVVAGNPCNYNGKTNISAYLEGSLSYQSKTLHKQEVLEDTLSTAGSLSQSRRTITIANLPRLSRRMAKVNFNRAPATPTPPSTPPSAPPTAPTGGSTAGGSGGVITGSGTADRGFLSFSGDLGGMRRAAAAAHLNEVGGSASAMQINAGAYPIDLWFGGSYTYFESEAGTVSQTGDIATAQFGVDTRIDDDLLVGFAVFGDLIFSDVSNSTETAGVGFMAGPYFVASLYGPLYLEGMAAGGRAYNRIQTPDQADARYLSDRLLFTARLSGDWAYDRWTFRPSTRVTYYAEKQKSFADSAGSIIPESTSVLGQMRFGPEIGYELHMDDASARPFVGVEGVWSFRQTEQQVEGAPISAEELSGGLSFGLDGRWGRATFRAGGRYDGLGDESSDAYSGELTVRFPFE